MNFNFKKNNILIILLLMFVILSCIVYINLINVKEGLANIATSVKKTDIKHGTFLTEIQPVPADLSYTYYKLTYPGPTKYNKLTDGITGLGLTKYPDFSINDVSYTSSTITDVSFIDFHKKYGMFGVSDLSNVNFYRYTSPNSTMVLNIDLSYTATTKQNNFNMLIKEFSGNIYEPSSNLRLTNLYVNISTPESIDAKPLIINGKFYLNPIEEPADPVITASGRTATATGGSVTLGDTNLNLGLLSSLLGAGNRYSDSEIYSYLLQDGGLGASYVPPIYNNFETAMNLPSNPIANPVNSMNPLDYAESLFGPKITPSMAKNSYLNQSDATTLESSANTMKAITSQTPNFDFAGNLLAQNSDGANSNSINSNSINSNSINSNSINSNSNSNSNTINSNKNIAKEDYPPCPAPQRCPEPNFECKKMPKYEQGIDNAFLPRPVLTDFSTFGM
jgi:hypothetical protein